MGHLQVEGTLDLEQFWPAGTSDGDTARVVVKRITFNGKLTHALDHAQVRGRTCKPVLDEHHAITVRLQGIDAPELHYMPSVPKAKAKKQNANFRQHYGRTAARALGTYLHTLGTGALKCRVVTQVSKPNEVFDTYGRFIGDLIVIGRGGKAVDINLWMAKNGWAFPTFYSSMSDSEILELRAAADSAARRKRGIWRGYESKLCFDHALQYRDAPHAEDAGAVSMPKIFRRLALDWVGEGNTRLHAFLASAPDADRCYKTDELLEQGVTVARQYSLAELVANTAVRFRPGEIVFQEAASMLVDGRGMKIKGW